MERSTGWPQQGSFFLPFRKLLSGPEEGLAGRKMLQWMMENPTFPAQNQGPMETSRIWCERCTETPVSTGSPIPSALTLFISFVLLKTGVGRARGCPIPALFQKPPAPLCWPDHEVLLPPPLQAHCGPGQALGALCPPPALGPHQGAWSAQPMFLTVIVLPPGGQVKHCSSQLCCLQFNVPFEKLSEVTY